MGFAGWVMVGLIALVVLVSGVLMLYGRRRTAAPEELVNEPQASDLAASEPLDPPRS